MTALGVQPGDEVIVPAFTWIATPNAVEYMGARPIFCDIDPITLNIDIAQIESCITPRTVGIVPVHLFGLCADMQPILDIAKKHDIWVVEDAACALGARYNGMHAGNFGDMGCFSFHPRKTITTGEGGMIVTRQKSLYELANSMRNHGAEKSSRERFESSEKYRMADHKHIGYNYRLTDIQGALGCVQMSRAEWIVAERTSLAAHYTEMFSDADWLQTPVAPKGMTHAYQSYTCMYCPKQPTMENVEELHRQRNTLMATLASRGIATSQGTHAPFLLTFYAEKYGIEAAQLPQAYFADRLSVSLPLYPQMTAAEQEYVIEEVQKAFANITAKSLC